MMTLVIGITRRRILTLSSRVFRKRSHLSLRRNPNDLIPQPDLGYLLEASDDELGLPPAAPSPSEECCGGSEDENAGFAPIWGYEDEAFDLGFVAIDEPFGFNDALCEPFDLFGGDYPDLVF
ncbi:uncharacterized protein LOC120259021 [Dioscorea cayenensis subsp. rotundata]|uniref:Uncharacterized protein LOC120259021 n=1 Tax=Dioscorea cayennensis subsp. rotundata TaxID=55577 RepID=A0AB40B6Z4_DIOCR|nr:uncharacterized protein LOC120259021 [Dioscorea cayenensis subsp. rotundata]